MINITVVGAGVHGARMALKYGNLEDARVRAVVSPHAPALPAFAEVPFFVSASAWKRKFGKPATTDVFDLCVHQVFLISVLKEFVKIGAKSFVLPKPIALTHDELSEIKKLAQKHALDIVVASQWYDAMLVEKIAAFVRKHKKSVASVAITFSRPADAARTTKYSPHTMLLPHMLQIATDLKLISKRSPLRVLQTSEHRLVVEYQGSPLVRLETDLAATAKTETVAIYLTGDKKPALIANFSGTASAKGFYTSLSIGRKKLVVFEDVLEAMANQVVKYFLGNSKRGALTLRQYLPVAEEVIRIREAADRSVAVIGGGIFGVLTALEIADQGYPVTLYEKNADILQGASLVNQCRVHMGYHYPRDDKTAKDSLRAKDSFEKLFGPAIVKEMRNYYMVAKEGSFTTPEAYLAFCKRIGLPYTEEWPHRTRIAKDKIALSVRVPENIFDANRIRSILHTRVKATPNLTLHTNATVTRASREKKRFAIEWGIGNVSSQESYAAIVNATYSGINTIHKSAGFTLSEYQYELCEMPVARTPWKGVGWSIIDGPFFGVMPFGFSQEYLLYDVELSVLERTVGHSPTFTHDVEYYDAPKRRAKRFKAYQKKWKAYAPEIVDCEQLYSLYIVRTVLPKKEKTDTRPTFIKQRAPGFWKIFSGKITTSVPIAKDVAKRVEAFLKSIS